MALRSAGREAIERAVSRKANFTKGNVYARWVDRNHYAYDYQIGMLPKRISTMLSDHSKTAELFVLYSYATPIAWYSSNDSDSNGTGKWYYVNQKYSPSTSGHQMATRDALMGRHVVTLSLDENDNIIEVEQEFYNPNKPQK